MNSKNIKARTTGGIALSSLAVACLTMAALIISSSACAKKGAGSTSNAATTIKALVSYAGGSVTIERQGVARKALRNDLLQASDVIVTGKNSSIDIMIQDYGLIKLAANSRMKLLSLLKGDRSNAEVMLMKGTAASFIRRRRKDDRFSVVTPTAIAGVRGTVFLTEVIPAAKNSKKKARVRIAVYSGAVAVKMPGQEEVVLNKNSQLVIDGFRKLTRSMVRTLSPESLREIKKMAVFHKNNILEFNTLVNELKSSSNDMVRTFEGGDVASGMEARERKLSQAHLGGDSVRKAARTGGSHVLKREVNTELIKLKPSSGYQEL